MIDKRIEAHLRVICPLSAKAIKEEIQPEQALKQVEAQWAQVMIRFQTTVKQVSPKNRPAAIASKEQVFAAWKKAFSFLLALLQRDGGVLHRYDEGPGGSTGFVILQGEKQMYWLHFSNH